MTEGAATVFVGGGGVEIEEVFEVDEETGTAELKGLAHAASVAFLDVVPVEEVEEVTT